MSNHQQVHMHSLGPHSPSNPKRCLNCGKNLVSVPDNERCHPRQVYTREQIKDLMLSMTTLILGPYHDREISAFIKAHPWTLKYLRMGFSEAERIREMAERDRGFVIVPVTFTEPQMRFRGRLGRDKNVVYETMGRHGQQFLFRFDWVAEDRYIAVSG